MDFLLQLAAGAVVRKATTASAAAVMGTCAKYLVPNVVVTAKHCVPEDDPNAYAVKTPASDAWDVIRIVKHPRVDVAVLFGRPVVDSLPTQVYGGVGEGLVEGGEFYAFGYPFEGEGAVGRVFRGHFQRYMGYRDIYGDNYFAGELSIAAPVGLSGGPVSFASAPSKLVAVVTANTDSYAIEHSHEELDDKGRVTRAEVRRIISYGIAAMLVGNDMRTWLDEVVREAKA